jgi:predicted GNAT family acetyltransferase
MSTTESTITLNRARNRFELLTDGKLSLVDFFEPDEHTLALTHTEVHPDLEGKGVGSSLVKQVLDYAAQHNQKIVPLCPFVDVYIKRHPDWQRVVSTEYSVDDF